MTKAPTDSQIPEPRGELALRTLAMPSDANPNGDIFGGWLMAQMDIAGGISKKGEPQQNEQPTEGKLHHPMLNGVL